MTDAVSRHTSGATSTANNHYSQSGDNKLVRRAASQLMARLATVH